MMVVSIGKMGMKPLFVRYAKRMKIN